MIEINETKTIVSDRIFFTSSEHSLGLEDLMIALEIDYERDAMKLPLIGIVGRANSGKSTLMNCLVGYDRVKVEDRIGTTRDNVICQANTLHHEFNFMDTAGYRTYRCALEFITKKRRENSLQYTDGVLLILDGQIGLTKTDKQILEEVMQFTKFIIICINKMDVLNDDPRLDFEFFNVPEWFPIVKMCAKENKLGNLKKTIDLCFVNCQKKITTPSLNKLLRQVDGKLRCNRNLPLGVKYIFQKSENKDVQKDEIKTIIPRMVFGYFAHRKLSKQSEIFLTKKITKAFNLIGVNIQLELFQKKQLRNVI